MNTDSNGFRYYNDLEEAKADGHSPVKATSSLCFFQLKGRTSIITASNLEPIPDLLYCVLAKSDGKYYVKESRGYDLDSLFFYRRSLTFSGEDTAIENLRRYIEDNNVWILYTPSQVESVAKTLLRLYTSKLSGEGKLSYPIYIKLLYESLMYEDYKGYGSSLQGFKTVCKGYEDRIDALWKYAYEQCQKKPVQ